MKITLNYLIGVLIWLIAYIIIRNLHLSLFPDNFNLENFTTESTHEFFKLICEITSSVFAILLAVITFGFELLGNNSRRRKRFNFLTQWWVSFAITIPIMIILFSLHSAFSLQNLKQTNDLTTAYFIGILFIVFVLSLFPFTVYLIKKTDTVDEIKKLINQFTGERDFDSAITDELIFYIQEFDRDAYNNNLLPQLNKRCLSIIGDASDRRQANIVFQSLTKIWASGNVDAARVNEEQYFISVWISVKDIYLNAAKNKSFLLHYHDIEDFIRTQIEYLTVKKSIEGLSSGVENLYEIYLRQLQFNCPQEETISILYWANEDSDAPNPQQDSDLQWNHINNILWELHQLQKNAIELNSKYLYEIVEGKLRSILFNLRYNHDLKLGSYQERFIVVQIFSFQTYYAQLALESGMFKYGYEAFHFSSFEISEYVKGQKIFVGDIIKQIEDYLLYCQKNNFLDEEISVKELGGLGRLIIMTYATSIVAQTELLSVVVILSKLKIEIEKKVNFFENKNYLDIKKELDSFKVQLEKVNNNSNAEKTILRIDEILNNY